MPVRRESTSVAYALRPLDADDACAVKSWEAVADLTEDGVVVAFRSAYCPTCGHDALPPLWSPPRLATAALGLSDTEQRAEQIVVRCACREPHADRPLTEPFGCGSVWTIRFAWSGGPWVSAVGAGPLPSPGDLNFAGRLEELQASELASVRSQAAGWSKVMAGLAGLLSAAQLFSGADAARRLAAPWPGVIGGLITFGVVLAAASAVLAALAAYGAPSSVRLVGTASYGGPAGALHSAVQQQVAKVRPALFAAAATALTAFVSTVVAAAFMWWAPPAP